MTTFGYDALNRLSTTTDASNNVTSTTYDPEGAVTARTDANGKSTSYTYDESGRLIATTDALGNQSAMGFCADIGGSPCQEVDANGNVTQRAFDVVGRTTAVSDGLGNTTTSKYDLVGHLTSVTDARGNATTYSYYHGVLNGVTTPAGATSYYFDARMNRKQVNGPVSTTYFTFDANNRVLTEENALSKTWTYTYNPDGTRATKLDPNGNTTKYGYDANKRLTSVTFADTSTYTFAYDSRGHRTTEQDADLNRSLTYDTLGRLSTILDGTLNKTLTYGYDAVGNRTSLTYDGLTLGYTWDANHRLTQIVDPDGEATNFTYDPGGRRTSMVQGNGVVTSYTYDDANRVTAIASPVQSFNYTYDVVGNPTSKTFADGTSEKYAYDTANRLTNVTTRAKGTAVYGQLDGEGNRGAYLYNDAASDVAQQISDSYGINTFDQVLTDSHGLGSFLSKNTYVYDGNGNRTTLTYQDTTTQPPPAAQVTTYTWNEDDRLTKITFPSAATNTYTYDANGIRTTKKDSVANLRYLLDGASIIATYDAVAKTRLTTFTQNPARIDEIVSTKTSGGSKYYPHADMLGSVHAVSDSTATTQATWTFDPYGTRTQASGTLVYAFGFAGREHDWDSGLVYSRQRYYDPGLGTWLQPDRTQAVTFKDGLNLYQYVQQRPTLARDPRGNITLFYWSEPDGSTIFDWWSEAQASGMGSTLSSYADSIADVVLTGAVGATMYGDTFAQPAANNKTTAGVTWPHSWSTTGTPCPGSESWFIALFPSHGNAQLAVGQGWTGGGFFMHELRHVIDDATGRFAYPSGIAGEARALATEILMTEQISGDYMDSDWLSYIEGDLLLFPAVSAVLADPAQRALLQIP